MKIKVVLLCHFSCAEVREKLPLSSLVFRNYLNFFLHRKKLKYIDYGRWNFNIINALKTRGDIELYVIAPHYGLCRSYVHYEDEGVDYYFYRSELQFPFNYIEKIINRKGVNAFRRIRKMVAGFIKEIEPDIVNLVGAENPYYSITALDIENIPIILHCQTVYANPDRKSKTGIVDKIRWDLEKELFRKIKYIACTGRMYYNLIKGYSPNAVLFPRKWPASRFPTVPDVEKKYDFVYWARYLNKNKGFDNAIGAMAKFVRKHPEAKFLAIGEKDHDWSMFEKRIKEAGLEDKIEIHAPFREYVDLLKYIKQSRFALLPITMDVLSGTILEALRMGMPVVTCRTSGTPSLNEKRETVLISDVGDSEGLSQNMLNLYDNFSLQERLRNNGFTYIAEKDKENENNVDIMVEQYMAVIEHYRHGTLIPTKLLYNIEENKDYRKNEDNKN